MPARRKKKRRARRSVGFSTEQIEALYRRAENMLFFNWLVAPMTSKEKKASEKSMKAVREFTFQKLKER
jgi:hypothetical protein